MLKTSSINREGEFRTVVSRDGTIVSFLSVGKGNGVIVLPGVLSMASDYAAFASALADKFSVHTLERRGRGRSGPQGDGYCIQKEIDDVLAVQQDTGAKFLVGHSYGGLIIFGFMLARLAGTSGLLYISIVMPQQHCIPMYNFYIQPMVITFASIHSDFLGLSNSLTLK